LAITIGMRINIRRIDAYHKTTTISLTNGHIPLVTESVTTQSLSTIVLFLKMKK